MAKGGSIVQSPLKGKVSSTRPFGKLATQNPAAGFGGSRMYLVEAGTGDEAYLAHFGVGPGDLLVKPGQSIDVGTDLGKVWGWPGDPGRSHIHCGFTGGDPLYQLVDYDGDIKAAPPAKPAKPQFSMRKVGKKGASSSEGRWQVLKEEQGKKPEVVFRGDYQEAKEYLEKKQGNQ